MLILLPPSEGKTAPAGGLSLDLSGLAFSPGLDRQRQQLISSLQALAGRSVKTAIEA